jgi:hypothetical protein
MRNKIIAGILMLGIAAAPPLFAQAADADEISQLKQRVSQLEKQIQQISQLLEPLKAQQAVDARRRALRARFQHRMAQDREKHTQDQLREAENLMRIADQQWGSPEANESLQKLIKDYPDFNRAGCAMLYIAQRSQGDERARCLQECIERCNDCFYGDGVQVGAYARFLLAADYKSKREQEKAAALYIELKTKYSDAVDHNGRLLADSINAEAD